MTTQLQLVENVIGDDLERLVSRLSRPGPRQVRSIQGAVQRGFAENFTREGSGDGPWAPLAPFTVDQRQRLGYGGQHPILRRTGRLRDSFVNANSPDHFSEVSFTGSGVIIAEGSDDERAAVLQRGRAGPRPMPARPVVTLDDGQESRIADTIDLIIAQLEREVIGA